MKQFSIAIDGPAGSGKSTVSDMLAERLGILHLDTGAMYRAMGLKALLLGIDPGDSEGVIRMLEDTELMIKFENGRQRVMLDGADVSEKIRENAVSKAASDIAVIPEVRLRLVEIQRNIAREINLVIDGRDIGSYVLPDTPYKFFITATPEERARRRLLELHSKGLELEKTLEEMTSEIIARDKTDSTREFAPLVCAENAVYIDTTSMSAEQVVERIIETIRKRERGR